MPKKLTEINHNYLFYRRATHAGSWYSSEARFARQELSKEWIWIPDLVWIWIPDLVWIWIPDLSDIEMVHSFWLANGLVFKWHLKNRLNLDTIVLFVHFSGQFLSNVSKTIMLDFEQHLNISTEFRQSAVYQKVRLEMEKSSIWIPTLQTINYSLKYYNVCYSSMTYNL